MNRTLSTWAAGAVLALGVAVFATADQAGQAPAGSRAAAMDADSDGKITKEEFMSFHEQLWTSLEKNADGTVDVSSMPMMMRHGEGMHGPGMRGGQRHGPGMMPPAQQQPQPRQKPQTPPQQ